MNEPLSSWRDFFVILGGGAASLAGLAFVAMSLHLRVIADSVPQRGRARATLTGLITVFMVCVFGLIPGQDARAFGVELIVGALLLGIWNVSAVRGIARSLRLHPDQAIPGYRVRSAIYGVWAIFLGVAGALLLAGEDRALFGLAVILTFGTVFTVINSWALLLDVSEREAPQR